MATHNDFGKEAEQEAVNYLIKEEYDILARNYRFLQAEVDIIARKKDILAIVEVKARSSTAYGEPQAFVSKKKIKLMAEAANHYVIKNDLDVEVRFDIISIVKNSREFSLQHLEDAFFPF